MIGKGAESEADKVPFPGNIISSRVDDMSQDVEHVLSEILQKYCLLCVSTKSTDITNKAQLLAFERFENEGEIMDFL
jgi:hypothetical protein